MRDMEKLKEATRRYRERLKVSKMNVADWLIRDQPDIPKHIHNDIEVLCGIRGRVREDKKQQ